MCKFFVMRDVHDDYKKSKNRRKILQEKGNIFIFLTNDGCRNIYICKGHDDPSQKIPCIKQTDCIHDYYFYFVSAAKVRLKKKHARSFYFYSIT